MKEEVAIELLEIDKRYMLEHGGDAQAVALDMGIKAIRKLEKIEDIIEAHDKDSMPEDYFYIDKIRAVLGEDNL